MVREFNVYWVNLDPTVGSEMKKKRPCLVLSNSEMNSTLGTCIIAPMTTTLRGYPSRVELRFNNKFCEVCLDQIRVVDESRLGCESLGRIKPSEIEFVKDVLVEIFGLWADTIETKLLHLDSLRPYTWKQLAKGCGINAQVRSQVLVGNQSQHLRTAIEQSSKLLLSGICL